MYVYTLSAQAGTRLWILQLTYMYIPLLQCGEYSGHHRKCFIYFICIKLLHAQYIHIFVLLVLANLQSYSICACQIYTFCCSFHDLENDPYVSALQIYPVCTSFYGISQVVSMPWCQSWRGTLKRQVGIYVLQIHSCLSF